MFSQNERANNKIIGNKNGWIYLFLIIFINLHFSFFKIKRKKKENLYIRLVIMVQLF
jgi:hypothetical protein